MTFKLLIQSLITFLAIDSFWIVLIASPWMKRVVPHLMAAKPNFLAAGAFYLLYLFSLLQLIIIPQLQSTSPTTLAWQSFLFGATAYATYDLTNLAVLKDYPWTLALADIVWGGTLTMLTAIIIWKLNQ